MVAPVQSMQSAPQVSQYGRLAAAGARGISTVDRNSQVEASSQHYTYDPDDDGILFNAYVDENNQRDPGQGDTGEQKDRRAGQKTLSAARRASDRDGAIPTGDDIDFASLLDPNIPFDLVANTGPSFYSVVNAVVNGAGIRGNRLDTLV